MTFILPASYFTDVQSFNLQYFLMNHPYVVVLVGVLLCLLAVFLPKPFKIGLLVVYLLFIAYMTLLLREQGDTSAEFEIFWSYRQFFSNRYYGTEILQNIWLFVPFGALMYSVSKHRILILMPLLLSVVIELIQLTTGVGHFEIDDIISNTLGGLIGFFIAYTITAIRADVRSRSSAKS